jgi:hypothetical protein
MHTSCLYSDIDWFIYADYLDDQNINHFIREDLQNEEIPWTYECCSIGVGISIENDDVGILGHTGVGAGAGLVGVNFNISAIGVGGYYE